MNTIVFSRLIIIKGFVIINTYGRTTNSISPLGCDMICCTSS